MKENKKSSTNILIMIIILLVVIIVLMGVYILYSRSDVSSKIDMNEKEDSTKKLEEDDKDINLPTDMNAVSKSINDNLGRFLTYRIDRTMNSNTQITLDNPLVNLLDNSSKRIDLVNSLLMNSNCSWTNSSTYQNFPYVTLDTYKEKYKEVYGSLDQFEKDKNNSSIFMANAVDKNMSADLIGWNGSWGVVGTTVTVTASNVTYDDTKEQFTITGELNFISEETNASIQTNDITINYVDNGEVKYIVSIVVK